MKEAGLTVGGFYKHFASREAFIAEVLASIPGTWGQAVAEGRAAGKSEEKILGDLVDTYLSEQHRDHPGSGCMFAAVGDDIGRSGDEARRGATEKLRLGFDLLASLHRHERKPEARALAIVTFSALVGAVTFARLVTDEALSREILRTVRKAVKSWAAEG